MRHAVMIGMAILAACSGRRDAEMRDLRLRAEAVRLVQLCDAADRGFGVTFAMATTNLGVREATDAKAAVKLLTNVVRPTVTSRIDAVLAAIGAIESCLADDPQLRNHLGPLHRRDAQYHGVLKALDALADALAAGASPDVVLRLNAVLFAEAGRIK